MSKRDVDKLFKLKNKLTEIVNSTITANDWLNATKELGIISNKIHNILKKELDK